MAESLVQVTEGSGKKLHTFQRTIGANNIEDEIVLLGDAYLAHYTYRAAGTALATANSHVAQLMAGASLNVYVRRVRIWQAALGTTAGEIGFQLLRLSTAGTGGTAVTPPPFDPSDAASGATTQSLPTVKGTEGNILLAWPMPNQIARPLSNAVGYFEWAQLPNQKAIRILAGTTNGIAIKNTTADATATVAVEIDFAEASF